MLVVFLLSFGVTESSSYIRIYTNLDYFFKVHSVPSKELSVGARENIPLSVACISHTHTQYSARKNPFYSMVFRLEKCTFIPY